MGMFTALPTPLNSPGEILATFLKDKNFPRNYPRPNFSHTHTHTRNTW